MGEFDNLNAPRPVVNGCNSCGSIQAPYIHTWDGIDGAGKQIIRGPQWCNTSDLNCYGAGLVTITQAPQGGLGDGTKPPDGTRGTASFANQSGITDKPILVALCNANGCGITIDGCGGRNDVIHIRTASGQAGVVITDKRVALYTMGTELALFGDLGKITFTYALVQEPDLGSGKVAVA